MFKTMSAFLAGIESLITVIGRATLWVALAMISLVALNVLLRYAFSFGSVWAQELEWHLLAGMILLGVAPCTAMVFVWSQLVKGDANYTLVQVSINDLVMVVAFAPIAAFLLGVTDLTVPWETLVLSTVLYVVLPLAAGMLCRRLWLGRGTEHLHQRMAQLKPWSVTGLIATVILLFGFQAPVFHLELRLFLLLLQ